MRGPMGADSTGADKRDPRRDPPRRCRGLRCAVTMRAAATRSQPHGILRRSKLYGAQRSPRRQSQTNERSSEYPPERSGDDDAAVARRSSSSLVLFTRRRRALRERPYAVCEFQHQQTIVLARRPQRAPGRVKVNLRRAPIGTAGAPASGTDMVRPRARDGYSSRVVVGDLLWFQWIANVEDADSGIEIAAS